MRLLNHLMICGFDLCSPSSMFSRYMIFAEKYSDVTEKTHKHTHCRDVMEKHWVSFSQLGRRLLLTSMLLRTIVTSMCDQSNLRGRACVSAFTFVQSGHKTYQDPLKEACLFGQWLIWALRLIWPPSVVQHQGHPARRGCSRQVLTRLTTGGQMNHLALLVLCIPKQTKRTSSFCQAGV